MMEPRSPRAPRGRFVLLRSLTAGFVLLGAAFMGVHLHDLTWIRQVANGVDQGRDLTAAERLQQYIQFAHTQIKNPRYADLPAGPVRLYYMLNPMHPGPGDVLRWGSDYRGGCGSHTRVVTAMLASKGIPSRSLHILDPQGNSIHTVVEARIGDRWVVSDPLYGIVYHRRDGALATREDLVTDYANFRRQVDNVRGYNKQLYDFDQATLFNWNKIPVVLPGIRKVLVMMFGEAWVAGIERPEIWMWPYEMYAVLCFLAAIVCAWWSLRLQPKKPAARVISGGSAPTPRPAPDLRVVHKETSGVR
jgi:hypothetical protein